MTAHSVRSEIERFLDALLESGLLLDFNKPIITAGTSGSTQVTWTNQASIADNFNHVSCFDEYVAHLKNRDFSAILFDGSLLQLSYTFSGNVLKKHRLCYYPCPVVIHWDELDNFALEELVDVLRSDTERLRLESPVRFDYDLDAGSEAHPMSHLHLARECCRIPVYAPLSLGHFVRFVFLNFYHGVWTTFGFLQEWACPEAGATITQDQRKRAHLNWVSEVVDQRRRR